MSSDGTHARPPLSVVVSITHEWQEIARCVAPLLRQAEEIGAEVILADAIGNPARADWSSNVVHLNLAGMSVFGARAVGLHHATGAVLATTEDHCIVHDGWCEGIIRAHEQLPEVDAVTGAFENGSPKHALDWANFFLIFGPFVRPSGVPGLTRPPVPANLSIKRRVVTPAIQTEGHFEFALVPRLYAIGSVRFEPNIVVSHVQSLGLAGFIRSHFHNSRACVSLRPGGATRGRTRRLTSRLGLPARLLSGALTPVRTAPALRWKAIASAPLILVLAFGAILGAIAGNLAGPGNSAHGVH